MPADSDDLLGFVPDKHAGAGIWERRCVRCRRWFVLVGHASTDRFCPDCDPANQPEVTQLRDVVDFIEARAKA